MLGCGVGVELVLNWSWRSSCCVVASVMVLLRVVRVELRLAVLVSLRGVGNGVGRGIGVELRLAVLVLRRGIGNGVGRGIGVAM